MTAGFLGSSLNVITKGSAVIDGGMQSVICTTFTDVAFSGCSGGSEQRAPGLRCFSPKVSPASTFRSPKWRAGIATASRRHPRYGGRPGCCRAHEAIGLVQAQAKAVGDDHLTLATPLSSY